MAEHEDLRKRKDFDKHKDSEERLAPPKTDPEVASQPVLPRDIFSNRFTLFLYFLVRDPIFWVSLVLFAIFLIFSAAAGSGLLVFFSVVTGLGSLISLIIVLAQFYVDISENFKLEQSMRFLSEIRDAKLGTSMSKWNIVASRMNDYLFETGHYPNRYAFYDGQDCYREFKRWYLLSRKDVFDAAPLEDSPRGVNGGLDYFKRQVSKDYYDSFDEYLTETYVEGFKSR